MIAGVVAAIILAIGLILILTLKFRIRVNNNRNSDGQCYSTTPVHTLGHSHIQHDSGRSLVTEASSPKETISTFSRPSPTSEDRNPDVIPITEGKKNLLSFK